MKNENYYIIHGWMINELHLKGSELVLYAIVYGFTQDGKSEFRGGIEYLQEWTELANSKVRQNINNLCRKGLIVKTRHQGSTNGLRAISPDITKKVKKQKATAQARQTSYDIEKYKRDTLNNDLHYERKKTNDK